MKDRIGFFTTRTGRIAVGLMTLQVIVKLTLELGKATEAAYAWVTIVAIAFTIGWVAIIALCVTGFRLGYWLGGIWGLLHFVTAIPLPLIEACDHYVLAVLVGLHGVLIAAACLAVLLIDARETRPALYRGMSGSAAAGFILLCVSVLVRMLWITLREPIGAGRALTAMTGMGGMAELAANSLFYILIPSMIALCVITPGIIMRRRWAFASAAIFGGIHAALTTAVVILRVNQGFGPAVVIPASLGNLIGGIWVLKSRTRGS